MGALIRREVNFIVVDRLVLPFEVLRSYMVRMKDVH